MSKWRRRLRSRNKSRLRSRNKKEVRRSKYRRLISEARLMQFEFGGKTLSGYFDVYEKWGNGEYEFVASNSVPDLYRVLQINGKEIGYRRGDVEMELAVDRDKLKREADKWAQMNDLVRSVNGDCINRG